MPSRHAADFAAVKETKNAVKRNDQPMDDLVREVLARSGEGSKQFPTSHLLWLRREFTKLLRLEISLEEREARIYQKEKHIAEYETRQQASTQTQMQASTPMQVPIDPSL